MCVCNKMFIVLFIWFCKIGNVQLVFPKDTRWRSPMYIKNIYEDLLACVLER
uniref:Uncharacterized protein n=1 Tax=Papilio xuthus TaxID=66420 RepID=I4DKK1_PAPXU|nr:unknown unsecreted protein [Papilio xuthus]